MEGGTYFFTVVLANRNESLLVDHIGLLKSVFRKAIAERPFRIDAMVVLPEHLHSIWTLPEMDSDYSGRWRMIKKNFTIRLNGIDPMLKIPGQARPRIWLPRFYEHTIRDVEDLSRCMDYIHFNPVKHGLVESVKDWPYSTFHSFVRRGELPADWGTGEPCGLRNPRNPRNLRNPD